MRAGPTPSVEERGNSIMKLNFQAQILQKMFPSFLVRAYVKSGFRESSLSLFSGYRSVTLSASGIAKRCY